jgi:hypothetical protein
MAGRGRECHISHVGDVLIVFRRLAARAGPATPAASPDPGARRRDAMSDPAPRSGASSGSGGSGHSGHEGDEVRLLRLRPKPLGPRT